MHRSHQTRLTTLTNQLNQEHAEQIDQLKSAYESRLNSESRDARDGNPPPKLELDPATIETQVKDMNEGLYIKALDKVH